MLNFLLIALKIGVYIRYADLVERIMHEVYDSLCPFLDFNKPASHSTHDLKTVQTALCYCMAAARVLPPRDTELMDRLSFHFLKNGLANTMQPTGLDFVVAHFESLGKREEELFAPGGILSEQTIKVK